MGFLSKGIGIPGKKLFAITIVNAGTLAWFMYFSRWGYQIVFQNFTNNTSLNIIGQVLFYLFAAVSAFVGVLLSRRISGMRLLWVWTLFGAICSSMVLFFKGEVFIFIFGPLLGIAMGLGFPYSLSLLASHTKLEQRGRAAGIMLLETFVLVFLAGFTIDFFNLGVIGTAAALIALKCTNFLGLATGEIRSGSKSADKLTSVSRIRISETNKTFLMYFLPWILFLVAIVLTDHIVWPTFEQYPNIYNILENDPWHLAGTAIFGLVAGFIADRFGRKIPIIIGLALLGFSLVLLGSVASPVTAFIHIMAIGIAFGFLMTVYSTIPGDLSEQFNAEKYYALIVILGLLTYFGLGALPLYFGTSATGTTFSWILTSLIFCSIAPVYLAKETLKEEKIRERQIKEYVKKVGKLVEDSKKTDKK